MSRKSSRAHDFRRRKPFISPRQSILIVCEGEKTEPYYFRTLQKGLRLTTLEVEVVGPQEGSAPISIVNQALEKKNLRRRQARTSISLAEYDKIWCVIDVEAPTPHASLNQAYDKGQANGLNLALSNPCFEFWYLLHFEKTSALMQSNEELLSRLKTHCQRYRENDQNFASSVFPHTQKAIANAEQVIHEKHYGADLRNCNPSTHVHLVVKDLLEIAAIPAIEQI
jgi:hypothetical protein